MLLPFQGATAPTRGTQGVASLALGYVLHWAFSPSLLNPKTSVSNVKHTYLLTCQLVNPLTWNSAIGLRCAYFLNRYFFLCILSKKRCIAKKLFARIEANKMLHYVLKYLFFTTKRCKCFAKKKLSSIFAAIKMCLKPVYFSTKINEVHTNVVLDDVNRCI